MQRKIYLDLLKEGEIQRHGCPWQLLTVRFSFIAIMDGLHDLNGLSDIEMLHKLNEYCNEEDRAEVQMLLYLNDTVGIGWGKPSAPEYEKEFAEREEEYYKRKINLLEKYDSKESWFHD